MSDYVEGQGISDPDAIEHARSVAPTKTKSEPPREKKRTSIGHYKLEKRIEGGKAECWLSRDERSGELRFLKKFPSPKMPGEDERITDHLRYEAELKRCEEFLSHHLDISRVLDEIAIGNGSLVKPLHSFWHESSFYKIYPYLPEIKNLSPKNVRNLPPQKRIRLIKGTLLALRELHERNIVHADIKPENIVLTEMPIGEVTRLIDFDDAFFDEEPPPPSILGGTEDYYSPEVLAYKGFVIDAPYTLQLGTHSDLFSLALSLHEVFSPLGKRPGWGGKDTADAGFEALNGAKVNFADLGTRNPLLEFRLKLCLSPNPKDRPRLSELLSSCHTNLGSPL